ncbi:hypothetical protein MCNS_17730 [Mycobacterium conspicuum]|uniref:Uncharacterized protein n=1 Tax=Mycobacterium conspicuum TaxID=44010 RepID=A0A7I7YAM6_9MYCO|nr:hypothetical protein MCNS_17730 [Mycobacterium conspicuum]
MPANGFASSAKRTAGAGPIVSTLVQKVPAKAATVRRGAASRATAPTAENFTSGKLVHRVPVADGR